MRSALILILVLFSFTMAGCSLVDTIAPPQYDQEGIPLPDTREPTSLVKGVAGVVPYGETGLAVFMLLVAGVERYKRAKTEKGLKATLMAGKRISKDPKMREYWDKVKEVYKQEHESSGSYNLIKLALTKLPKVF